MRKVRSKKNKYILNGKNGKIALQMLHDITDILDKYNINYWLDFGTLLGVIRENRLLPWDDDIDISIFEADKEIMINKVLPAIQKAKYRAYTKRLEEDAEPFKKGNVRAFKIRNNRLFFFRGYVTLDIFIMYNYEESIYWYELGRPHILPRKLVAEFEMIEFNGKKYRVPKEYDAYLTYHYGDWRIPNKEYNASLENIRTLA